MACPWFLRSVNGLHNRCFTLLKRRDMRRATPGRTIGGSAETCGATKPSLETSRDDFHLPPSCQSLISLSSTGMTPPLPSLALTGAKQRGQLAFSCVSHLSMHAVQKLCLQGSCVVASSSSNSCIQITQLLRTQWGALILGRLTTKARGKLVTVGARASSATRRS